jgi:hypothetical protein
MGLSSLNGDSLSLPLFAHALQEGPGEAKGEYVISFVPRIVIQDLNDIGNWKVSVDRQGAPSRSKRCL